jgi:hypothetical protein
MKKMNSEKNPKEHVDSSPQSALERELIREYLRDKGYRWEDLRKLPREESRLIMKQACQYASLKLTEIEAKAGFRRKIQFDGS